MGEGNERKRLEDTDLLKRPPKEHVLKVWSPEDVMALVGPGGRKVTLCGYTLDRAIGTDLSSFCSASWIPKGKQRSPAGPKPGMQNGQGLKP